MLNKIQWLAVVCFLSSLLSMQAYSQSAGSLFLSTGIQDLTSRDRGFSPQKYSGIRSMSTATFQLHKPHKTELFQFDFAYGPLGNRIGNSLNAMTIGFLTYTYYHKNKPGEKSLHWGWSNQNLFNIRRHNGFSNYSLRYDYFTSLGPSVRYIMPLQWKGQQFEWYTSSHLQVVGFQIKSGFIGANPDGYSEENTTIGNFFESMEPFIIGKDWNFGLTSTFYWELPSENKLGLNYRLDVSGLQGSQPVARFGNALLLVLKVKLW